MAENPRTPWEYEFPEPAVSVPEGGAREIAKRLVAEAHYGVMTNEQLEDNIAEALLSAARSTPIDMILYCPACGAQHVDAPDERTPDWSNPPHRSHLCHGCGHIWRPADVPTNGVAAIKTVGKADSPVPDARSAESRALDRAVKAAEANYPRNEPGEYARGRFAAADAIRSLSSPEEG